MTALLSREECFKLLRKYAVPEHVIRHSVAVEKVAVFLAKKLVATGEKLDVDLVWRAALLHDIDKLETLGLGSGHGKRARQILKEEGLPVIGQIALKHHLSYILRENPFASWEEKIVYYADKRVNHSQIVSLEERFNYLLERYGKQKENFEKISSCREKVEALEEEIFAKLKADKSLEFTQDSLNE